MKPVATEKAVMMMERANTLVFEVERRQKKEGLKKEIEDLFDVKVERINTLIRNNKKYAYVQLKKNFLAIDLATKLGMI